MTKRIKLGDVSLDVSDIASQGNALLGIRDSGKTWGAIFLAEQLQVAGIPFLAFDPIGRWRHLGTPGTGKGFPIVVAGGEHGDLPLTPQSAPEIVRAAMRERVSLVLDLYSMELSKADWRRIVMASVSALLYENKAYGLRHVFIEEAAEFVPQNVNSETAKVYDQIERLARMGGNALLGYTLINQRAEQVNKAVLELCDNLFLFRQKGKNSLTSLSKWLDIGSASQAKEIIGSLPTLPQGTCWVWAAGTDHPVRVKMPGIQTFSPDRRAQHVAGSAPPARVDVGKFVEGMKGSLAAVIAEAEANDPAKLKAEIARLKKDIAAGVAAKIMGQPPAGISQEEANKSMDAAHALGKLEGEAEMRSRAKQIFATLGELITERVSEAVDGAFKSHLAELMSGEGRDAGARAAFERAKKTAATISPASRTQGTTSTPIAARRNIAPRVVNGGSDGPLKKMERAILTALAQWPLGLTTRQLQIRTRYSLGGGAGSRCMTRMRAAGWIETMNGLTVITTEGSAALGAYDPLPTGDALLRHWLGNLNGMEAKLLAAVAEAYPEGVTVAELAETTGYSLGGGAGSRALTKLRGLDLIAGKPIKASDELFG